MSDLQTCAINACPFPGEVYTDMGVIPYCTKHATKFGYEESERLWQGVTFPQSSFGADNTSPSTPGYFNCTGCGRIRMSKGRCDYCINGHPAPEPRPVSEYEVPATEIEAAKLLIGGAQDAPGDIQDAMLRAWIADYYRLRARVAELEAQLSSANEFVRRMRNPKETPDAT